MLLIYFIQSAMKRIHQLLHWLSGMRLARKLGASFSVVLALTLIIGCFSIYELAQVNRVSGDLASIWMPNIGNTTTFRSLALELRELEVKHANAADVGYMDEYEEKMKTSLAAVTENTRQYEARPHDAESNKLYEAVRKAWAAYQESSRRVVQLGREEKPDDAKDISDGASKSNMDDVIAAIDKLTAYYFQGAQHAAEQADANYRHARQLTTGLLIFAVALGAFLAMVITRNLIRQLGGEPRDASQLTSQIAEGKLYVDIQLRDNDEYSLLASIRNMRNGIARIVKDVRSRADHIALASSEIDQGNIDLAHRTGQQAAALRDTAHSIEHLKETLNQNADGARQASQFSADASSVASDGGKVVAQVVDTMREINDSSKKIFDIVSIIDSIAFQTNILALNAAVEAARAGEQGRGFAVVASEVRNLASRSAAAAKDIKHLVSTSVERVEKGSAQVDRAGATMANVVESIRRVTELIGDISTASDAQRNEVANILQSISQIDDATQQNSALVEQMAAAASHLSTQAQELVETAAIFVLNEADERHNQQNGAGHDGLRVRAVGSYKTESSGPQEEEMMLLS